MCFMRSGALFIALSQRHEMARSCPQFHRLRRCQWRCICLIHLSSQLLLKKAIFKIADRELGFSADDRNDGETAGRGQRLRSMLIGVLASARPRNVWRSIVTGDGGQGRRGRELNTSLRAEYLRGGVTVCVSPLIFAFVLGAGIPSGRCDVLHGLGRSVRGAVN